MVKRPVVPLSEKIRLFETAKAPSNDIKAVMRNRFQGLNGSLLKINQVKANAGRRGKIPKRDEGRLKHFVDLPLDIFFEIASSLEPMDIINLSRLNKDIRAVFMSPEARFVWARTLKRVPGLPECPPDMNEPQYASFMFEQMCSACYSIRASRVYFALRVRFCCKCERANMMQGKILLDELSESSYSWEFDENLCFLLPTQRSSVGNKGSAYNGISSLDNNQNTRFLRSDFDLVVKECRAFGDDVQARLEYMEDRRTVATALMLHGHALADWDWAQTLKIRQDTESFLRERHKLIYAEMKKLGWDEKYYPENRLHYKYHTIIDHKWRKLMDERKPFTSKSWIRLRPRLEEVYKESKREYIRHSTLGDGSALRARLLWLIHPRVILGSNTNLR